MVTCHAKVTSQCGLYPVNRRVFQPEDFAPSKVFVMAYVPDSFPTHVPSSNPIEPSSDDDKDFKDSSECDSDSESSESDSENSETDGSH